MSDTGSTGRGLSEMSKTILASVIASLIVAAIINGLTFVATMSKMGTIIENLQNRTQILEQKHVIVKDILKKTEVDIAKIDTIISILRTDMSNISSDVRGFHFNRSAKEDINR